MGEKYGEGSDVVFIPGKIKIIENPHSSDLIWLFKHMLSKTKIFLITP